MNVPYLSPPVLPCWINGYRSATGGTWHGDPHSSLEEAIERARGVEKSGRSRLAYRWCARAKVAPPALLAVVVEGLRSIPPEDVPVIMKSIDDFLVSLPDRGPIIDFVPLAPFPPIIGRMPTFVPAPAEVAPAPESPPAPVPAPAKAKPAPKARAVAEPGPETTFQEPARNTRKTGNTQKDAILDAYGTTGDLPAVLAARLDVVRTTVVSTIAAARADRDPRITTGDRRATMRRAATARKGTLPDPGAKDGGVVLASFVIPRGKACLVDEGQGAVFGPIGRWAVPLKAARLLNLMSDGSLYGPHVMEKAGYARGALEDTLRPMKAKLASIGIRLTEVPKVGFRLEIAE